MSKRRPAHTVNLIKHRLDVLEHGDVIDPLELLGLHDELTRLERKWREQLAAGSERRKSGDVEKLNDWFARLLRLVDRSLRAKSDAATENMLKGLRDSIGNRSTI